jgi:hypothetical protein
LARREINEFFQMMAQEAKGRGGDYIYKEDFIHGWKTFSSKPCYETAVQFLDQAPEYASCIFSYFEGCCRGGKCYRAGFVAATRFQLGNYHLGMPLKEIDGLRELSREEYKTFGQDSLQEAVYHANSTEFIGRHWRIMVGATEGRLYQIAANLEINSQDKTRELTDRIFKHCEFQLGTPSEENPGLFVWDTNDGSVVFQFAIIVDTFAANLLISNKGHNRYGNS